MEMRDVRAVFVGWVRGITRTRRFSLDEAREVHKVYGILLNLATFKRTACEPWPIFHVFSRGWVGRRRQPLPLTRFEIQNRSAVLK